MWLVFISIIRRMRNKGKKQMEEALGNVISDKFPPEVILCSRLAPRVI